jgi:DNA recombination protein RmuC
VVTPSTLYATLKLIEQLWRYERQSENVVKLIDRASKLHDKMVDFVTAFEDIGRRLRQAQESYDTAHNRIRSGRGNVIKQIDQLGQLAGKTQKELPKHLTESAAVSDQLDGSTTL